MELPNIGREIPWSQIVRQVFRVLSFDKKDTLITKGDKLKTKGFLQPYGLLVVESPILKQQVILPIMHHDDFILASSVFDDPTVAPRLSLEEMLVCYAPKKKYLFGFGGTQHGLHYVLTPKGTLEKYYEFKSGFYRTNPDPEILFGPFKWHGLIQVEINSNPILG